MKKINFIFGVLFVSGLFFGCATTEKTSENAKTESTSENVNTEITSENAKTEKTQPTTEIKVIDYSALTESDIGTELTIAGFFSFTDLGPCVRVNSTTKTETWFYLQEDENEKEAFDSLKNMGKRVTVQGILTGVQSKFIKELSVLSVENMQ